MANAKIMMADTINRFAKDYEQMVKAAEFLKEIGTNEQIADELQAAAEAARKEAAAAQDEAKKAKEDAKKAKEKVAEMILKANDQALEVVREGEQKGQAMVDAAAVRAGDIIAAAERQAADRTAGVAGQVAQLTSTKVHLEQDVAGLQIIAETKRLEIEQLEARLAKVQAQIAKYLG